MALRKVNQEWDACMARFVQSGLKGAALGTVIGITLFKKKIPCIAYFTGLGAGISYVECEKKFNSFLV